MEAAPISGALPKSPAMLLCIFAKSREMRRAATSARKRPTAASAIRSQIAREISGIVRCSRTQRSAPRGSSRYTRPLVCRARSQSSAVLGVGCRNSSPARRTMAARTLPDRRPSALTSPLVLPLSASYRIDSTCDPAAAASTSASYRPGATCRKVTSRAGGLPAPGTEGGTSRARIAAKFTRSPEESVSSSEIFARWLRASTVTRAFGSPLGRITHLTCCSQNEPNAGQAAHAPFHRVAASLVNAVTRPSPCCHCARIGSP